MATLTKAPCDVWSHGDEHGSVGTPHALKVRALAAYCSSSDIITEPLSMKPNIMTLEECPVKYSREIKPAWYAGEDRLAPPRASRVARLR